jgi:hypothetical protein
VIIILDFKVNTDIGVEILDHAVEYVDEVAETVIIPDMAIISGISEIKIRSIALRHAASPHLAQGRETEHRTR